MVRVAAAIVGVLVALIATGLAYVRVTGLRAAVQPGAVEQRVARAVRSFAVPGAARDRANPLSAGADVLAAGMAHYADHCAVCHANDGSGDTDFGRAMFPPPPDMRLEATQRLSDGELFYIIENGIRFTGMPAFGMGHDGGESETWQLVHFLRHLPDVTPAELERMRDLNPRPAEEIRQEIEEERFLRGEP